MDENAALRYSARVTWSQEDRAFVAVCPEFEGISAFASSGPEAVHELNEALQLALEAHKEEGWPIPEPLQELRYSGQFRLRLPRSLHGWMAERAQVEGVSLNTLVVELLARARGAAETADRTSKQLDESLSRLERAAREMEVL